MATSNSILVCMFSFSNNLGIHRPFPLLWHSCEAGLKGIPLTFFWSSPEDVFVDRGAVKGGGERERHGYERKTSIGFLLYCQGTNLQSRYVPWMGTDPTTFWCPGQCSNQLSHLPRVHWLYYQTNLVPHTFFPVLQASPLIPDIAAMNSSLLPSVPVGMTVFCLRKMFVALCCAASPVSWESQGGPLGTYKWAARSG